MSNDEARKIAEDIFGNEHKIKSPELIGLSPDEGHYFQQDTERGWVVIIDNDGSFLWGNSSIKLGTLISQFIKGRRSDPNVF